MSVAISGQDIDEATAVQTDMIGQRFHHMWIKRIF